MKNFIKKLGVILSLVSSIFGVSGCTTQETEVSIDPKYIVDISRLEYTIKDYETEEAISRKTLTAGKEYYMEVAVEYSAGANTDGSVLINGVLKLYNVANLQGTIEDANSANASQKLTFSTDNSEEECQVTTVSFIVPQVANQVKNMRIRLRLTPTFSSGTSNSKASCRASLVVAMEDPKSRFKIGGDHADGETFTVYVERSKLDTPVISVNDSNEVSWNHVENAIEYDIYVGNDLLKTIKVPANKYTGDKITYYDLFNDLAAAKYTSSTYVIYIVAKGGNNYLPSASNEERVEYISWD